MVPLPAASGAGHSAANAELFAAVADTRRREILAALAAGERPVGELVEVLDVEQPVVSKHLRILRNAGLVAVRRDGRQRWYRVDGRQLKALHDWTRQFERYWDDQLAGIKRLAEDANRKPSTT